MILHSRDSCRFQDSDKTCVVEQARTSRKFILTGFSLAGFWYGLGLGMGLVELGVGLDLVHLD